MDRRTIRRVVIVAVRIAGALGLVLSVVVSDGMASPLGRRPPRTNHTETLFQGVTYLREARVTPRLLMVHVIRIDLTAPGVHFLVTPGDPTSGLDARTATTSAFARRYKTQVAINGGFFKPFDREDFPLEPNRPHTADAVDISGLAISNGTLYSTDEPRRAKLCLTGNRAVITRSGCPSDTTNAIAGNWILAHDGMPAGWPRREVLHPRTAVGVDASGQTLWLFVVDGRQPGYSEGVSLPELAKIAVGFGADTVLNLDGGGSSAMVVGSESRPSLLNAPIEAHIPMRERRVGNHLGVFALPAADE